MRVLELGVRVTGGEGSEGQGVWVWVWVWGLRVQFWLTASRPCLIRLELTHRHNFKSNLTVNGPSSLKSYDNSDLGASECELEDMPFL